MTIKRGLIYATVLGALLAGYWLLRKRDRKIDGQIATTVLTPAEVAKVVLNPATHVATIITRSKPGGPDSVRSVYLPPHTTAIAVNKDGTIKLQTRNAGTEISPFVGFALGSDVRARAALGLNLLYLTRFDLGVAFMTASDIHTSRVAITTTYNCYGNINAGLYVDNHHDVGIMAVLRF